MAKFKDLYEYKQPKEILIGILDKGEGILKKVRDHINDDTDMADRWAKQELKKAMQTLRLLDKKL